MTNDRIQIAGVGRDTIVIDGRPLSVSPRIHRMIALLLDRAGTTVGHVAVRNHFSWPADRADNNAKVAICQARHALRRVEAPVEIESVYGHGYRLQVIA